MQINEKNKELYESAFISDGEYPNCSGDGWKPSINENEISEWCGNDDGVWVPATPLGYRDYLESRTEGIKKILAQEDSVDLTDDKFHHLKRWAGTIKQYDKIKTDSGDFVVTHDDEENYYVVDAENHQYYIAYEE